MIGTTHLVISRPELLFHAPPFRALQVGHERRESALCLDTKTGLEVVLSVNRGQRPVVFTNCCE
jgi:hypothetical protein